MEKYIPSALEETDDVCENLRNRKTVCQKESWSADKTSRWQEKYYMYH